MNKIKIYKKIKIGIILTLLVLLTSCSNIQESNEIIKDNDNKELNEAEESKNLRKVVFGLDLRTNTNHTGIYVADSLGYYEELGIDLDILQPTEGDSIPVVSTGYADFGISSQDNIAQVISGDSKLPIVAVASITKHNNSGILSRKGEGIHTPKGLEGKRYETWDKPIEHEMLRTVMERDGGDFSKLKRVPFTPIDELDALKTDHVDAVWIYYGWTGIEAEIKGFETDYFEFKDLDPVFDFYSPVIITNEQLIENDKELVKDFMKATKKGYEFAIENPKEAADILLENDTTLDREFVHASQEWISKEYKKDLEQWGTIDPNRWELFFQWLQNKEIVLQDLDLQSGFTNEFVED